jgi:1,4-alpha-glucan branching enzyme
MATTEPGLHGITIAAVGESGGVLRIPAPGATSVEVRLAPLSDRDLFDPLAWDRHPLAPDPAAPGWHLLDLDTLGLADGAYEYEFVLGDDAARPVADPYAEELVRFGGYRGVFHIRGGRRWRQPFSWADELTEGATLPENNRLVIYEMPLRWMLPDSDRQVGLGDFDHAIFEHLDDLAELGINCIELLPVQDSADTLNWGYGTRFFFAPDIDMGSPVDMKFFVKRCHQLGIRVIMDVVMNHARKCPLEQLAFDWFFLRDKTEEGDREDWGGRLFRYRTRAGDGSYAARELHYRTAEFWIREYHVDGFRIDEFKGIDHWEFVQTFRDRAWAAHRALFPDRPFLVVAEDSWRRAAAAQARPTNPGGRKVVDSIWNFAFQEEARHLLRDRIDTRWGEPPRRERIRALVGGWRQWNGLGRRFHDGFGDLAEAVNYITSHDVEQPGEQRFVTEILGEILRERGLGDGGVEQVRRAVDGAATAEERVREAHRDALHRAGSAFALLLTSVGIPMFLAGEEFGDVHDLEHRKWWLKMSDPVDWSRAAIPAHRALRNRVAELIRLRTSAPALQRNEVEFFYFHPGIDHDGGVRVFAFCRTGGAPLGSRGQVAVVVNAGPHRFPDFGLPWPWSAHGPADEVGAPPEGGRPVVYPDRAWATLSLAPFEVRVFGT